MTSSKGRTTAYRNKSLPTVPASPSPYDFPEEAFSTSNPLTLTPTTLFLHITISAPSHMANRSNPNTPASLKGRTAAKLRQKRKHIKRIIAKSKGTEARVGAAKTTAATTSGKGTVTGPGSRGRISNSSQAIKMESGRRRREEEKAKREEKRLKKANQMDIEVSEDADKEEEVMGMEIG